MTEQETPGRAMPLSLVLLAVGIVCFCFFIFAERPQIIEGDIGYPAFSALQYVRGEVGAFDAVHLADSRDLSKDVDSNIIAFPPAWTLLFLLAFKAGLSPGPAARVIELILSLGGALGWVWITYLLGLRKYWRAGAVILASFYCLRGSIVTVSDIGDPIVYCVAPWLIGAALVLSRRFGNLDRRSVGLVAILCGALGSLYWLKYSAVFFGMAVLSALLLELYRQTYRPRPSSAIAIGVLCAAAFALPILAQKAWNYARTGTDLIEETKSTAPQPATSKPSGLIRGLVEETIYESGALLFGVEKGLTRVTRDHPPLLSGSRMAYQPIHWLLRLPGLLGLALFFYLVSKYPQPFVRNLSILLIAFPALGFLALSITSGSRFVSALVRASETSCIFVELLVLALLSQRTPVLRKTRLALAIVTAIQLVFFSYLPYEAISRAWTAAHMPRYETSAASIYVTDFSRTGSRAVTTQIAALLRGPGDVIVPATPHRGLDTWLELDGHRLLPLTSFWMPLAREHGRWGANYNGDGPLTTSRPLRVVLVACNPYNDPELRDSVPRLKSRFPQAKEWTRQPAPSDSRVELWTADLVPGP
ncbi:MAG: hypothetical protein M3N54_06200 [Acidobacteriota bacterium]|nr:hypothetical protein [Acidobacteriota bacterium]